MKNNPYFSIVLGLALASFVAGCGDDTTNPPDNPQTGIECGDKFCDPDTQECKDGECVNKEVKPPETKECESDADCKDDAKECKENKCVAKTDQPEDPPKPTECGADETLCDADSLCHNLKTDHSNCGECGKACEGGELCKDGVCEFSCENGEVACGKTCTDLKKDPSNCNECGKVCGTDQICDNGECKCGDNKSVCEDGCFDLTSDVDNCGECGKKCNAEKSGYVCKNSQCILDCGELKLCSDSCVNTASDPLNCGECGNACKTEEGELCVNGGCLKGCDAGLDRCDDGCFDLETDANHCGSCDIKCDAAAGESCEDGKCAVKCAGSSCTCEIADEILCAASDDRSEKVCANPNTSNTRCGCTADNPGVDCSALANTTDIACVDGQCQFDAATSCNAGYADCDNDASTGCETDLNSINSCGACGNKCDDAHVIRDGLACILGTCQPTCEEGYSVCDGKCLDLNEDTENCGWCGNKCDSGQACIDGFCTIEECGSDGYVTTNVTVRNGDGTLGSKSIRAYCINNSVEFENMRTTLNTGARFPAVPQTDAKYNSDNAYILMDSINFGISGQLWEPIGTSTHQFEGYFLGNGQMIKGKISTEGQYTGLFGQIKNSTIDGLNLKLDVTNDGSSYAGALAGGTQNVVITRVKKVGNMKCGYRCGGLIGYATSPTILRMIDGQGTIQGNSDLGGVAGAGSIDIDNCVLDHDIDKHSFLGGIVGSGGGTANHCKVSGTVGRSTNNNARQVGGIFGGGGTVKNTTSTVKVLAGSGYNIGGLTGSSATVENSVAMGDVLAGDTSYNVGGLVGTTSNTNLTNSYATGNVTCSYQCAGLVGSIEKGTVSNCHATGKVTSGSDHDKTGGLIGLSNGTVVENSYATGDVVTTTVDKRSVPGFGGLIGRQIAGSVTNCYATGNVNGNYYTGGLIGCAMDTVITNGYAKGNVVGEVTSGRKDGQYVGGAIGYLSNSKIKNIRAMGNVNAGSDVGGLVGYMTNSSIDNSEAFGSVTGSRAGGLVGTTESYSSINLCAAVGDAVGEDSGTVLGFVSKGTHNVKNVYGSGLITGVRNTGLVVGRIDTASSTSLTLKKVYYWKTASTSGKVAGAGEPVAGAEAAAFNYAEDTKEAVMDTEEASKLVDVLNGNTDNWVSAKCKLSSGPGSRKADDYIIPILKNLGTDICAE